MACLRLRRQRSWRSGSAPCARPSAPTTPRRRSERRTTTVRPSHPGGRASAWALRSSRRSRGDCRRVTRVGRIDAGDERIGRLRIDGAPEEHFFVLGQLQLEGETDSFFHRVFDVERRIGRLECSHVLTDPEAGQGGDVCGRRGDPAVAEVEPIRDERTVARLTVQDDVERSPPHDPDRPSGALTEAAVADDEPGVIGDWPERPRQPPQDLVAIRTEVERSDVVRAQLEVIEWNRVAHGHDLVAGTPSGDRDRRAGGVRYHRRVPGKRRVTPEGGGAGGCGRTPVATAVEESEGDHADGGEHQRQCQTNEPRVRLLFGRAPATRPARARWNSPRSRGKLGIEGGERFSSLVPAVRLSVHRAVSSAVDILRAHGDRSRVRTGIGPRFRADTWFPGKTDLGAR